MGLIRGALVGLLLLFAPAPVPGAQDPTPGPSGSLLEADLTVEAVAPGPLRVELTYRLRPDPGLERIPIRALPVRGVRAVGPTARVWEDPVSFSLDVDGSGMLVGTVPLPAPARPDDVVVLRLRYRVVREAEAGDGPVRVPVLAVPWPPAEALPGTFSVRVDLPAGTRMEEGFPASWSVDAEAPTEDLARYRAELPVLPAFVSFRAGGVGATGGRPRAGGPPAREVTAPVAELVRRAGFVFWGLFAVFGATVALYLVWMVREERRERGRVPSGPTVGTPP